MTTDGFETGGPLEPGSVTLEQSLQALGGSLQARAKSAHVALMGISTQCLVDSSTSDNALFTAMRVFTGDSGYLEPADAPVLMFGLDAGSLVSQGLASRIPQRAIAVLMRVPTTVPALTEPSALAVPTFGMKSELDGVAVNTSSRATFARNRSRGPGTPCPFHLFPTFRPTGSDRLDVPPIARRRRPPASRSTLWPARHARGATSIPARVGSLRRRLQPETRTSLRGQGREPVRRAPPGVPEGGGRRMGRRSGSPLAGDRGSRARSHEDAGFAGAHRRRLRRGEHLSTLGVGEERAKRFPPPGLKI